MAKKLTTEEFVTKAKEKHTSEYDYSKVAYVNNRTKVTIICKKHGEFNQKPDSHLQGSGCRKCNHNKNNSRAYTLEKFLAAAISVHGDYYDYSNVKFKNLETKVNIICPKHGSFEQTPQGHILGRRCLKCSYENRAKTLTTEEFISKAKEIHKVKYDYSKVNYVRGTDRVVIVCPKHGEFEQKAQGHLCGYGCRKCKYEKKKKNCYTLESFIEKANEKHNNFYDYSKVDFKNTSTKVVIICPEHGEFEQLPSAHLQGSRCRDCGYKIVTEKQTGSSESFIEKAKGVHGGTYDYSKVKYKVSNKKVTVICLKHGEFKITPNQHLLGQGCRKCGYERMSGVPEGLRREAKRIKTLISSVYCRGTYTKYSKIHDILGCNWGEFKEYLEHNEFGFIVGQEGLDLDHIIPISSAQNEKDLIGLTHYTNFQLLPSYYNRYIKKDKDFNMEHFKKWYKENYQKSSTTV